MKTNRKTGMVALLTAGTLAASSLMNPAMAADKSKTYKAGALVLGGVAAYLLVKGKTVPAAIAGAAGYYAYKQGQKADGRSSSRFPDDDFYGDARDNGDVYPDSGPYASVPSDDDATYPNDPGYGDTGYGTPDGGFFPGYGLNARKAQPSPRRALPRNGARTVLK